MFRGMGGTRRQLRVLYPELKPAINRCMGKFPRIHPSAQCNAPGFMVEILATIIDQLSIDIVPFTPDLEDRVDGHILGAIVGNDSTGLLDYILDGRVDTVAIPFHDYDYGFSEGKMFDVSAPIYNTTASFFYKRQLHHANNWLEFFRVYNRAVWMALGLLFLVVNIFLHVARYLEIKLDRQKPDMKQRFRFLCQIVWYSLQFMLGHAQFGKFRSSSVNWGLLLLSCCYGSLVMGIYGSWILSLRLDPVTVLPIKDIDHLARLIGSQEYHLQLSPIKARNFELLRRANLSILRKVSEALESNPIRLSSNNGSTSGVVGYLSVDRSVAYTEADDQLYIDLQKRCGITEVMERILNIPAVFVFQKGSPFLEPFNKVIDKNRDLFLKITNRYLGVKYDDINNKLCQNDMRTTDRHPYFGLCGLLAGMCILGIFVLICENIVYYFLTRKSTKQVEEGGHSNDVEEEEKNLESNLPTLVERALSSSL